MARVGRGSQLHPAGRESLSGGALPHRFLFPLEGLDPVLLMLFLGFEEVAISSASSSTLHRTPDGSGTPLGLRPARVLRRSVMTLPA